MAESSHLSRERLQYLLSAAYILQHSKRGIQHENLEQPADCVHRQHTEVLSKVLAFQKTLATEELGFSTMVNSIVNKAVETTGCCGAAIGLVEENEIHYCAVAGRVPSLASGRLSLGSSLCARCVENNTTFLSNTPNRDTRLPATVRHKRWLRSLIAVPIIQKKSVSAVFEFYFNVRINLEKETINVCELLALSVGQALQIEDTARAREQLNAERSETLAKLEQLRPQLERLAEDTDLFSSSQIESLQEAPRDPLIAEGSMAAPIISTPALCSIEKSNKSSLWNRTLDPITNHHREPFWPWQLPDRAEVQNGLHTQSTKAPHSGESNDNGGVTAEFDPVGALLGTEGEISIKGILSVEPGIHPSHPNEIANFESVSPSIANSLLDHSQSVLAGGDTDKAKSQDWRANVYVLLAALTIIAALSVQGYRTKIIPSAGYHGESANNSAENKPDEPSSDDGNPQANVWVDLKHAHYYCSDSRQYGKTRHGKFMKQGQAQLNHYQPAEAKVCD